MKENNELKEACAKEEAEIRERVEKVAAILEANDIHYKTETAKAEAIISFAKANLSYEEIEQLVKPLSPDYLAGQIYKKGIA